MYQMNNQEGGVMSENLRNLIIQEIKRNQSESAIKYGNAFSADYVFQYCTWWFKFNLPFSTKVIRRELDRMEKEGLVISDKSQSNNTKWKLAEHLR